MKTNDTWPRHLKNFPGATCLLNHSTFSFFHFEVGTDYKYIFVQVKNYFYIYVEKLKNTRREWMNPYLHLPVINIPSYTVLFTGNW